MARGKTSSVIAVMSKIRKQFVVSVGGNSDDQVWDKMKGCEESESRQKFRVEEESDVLAMRVSRSCQELEPEGDSSGKTRRKKWTRFPNNRPGAPSAD